MKKSNAVKAPSRAVQGQTNDVKTITSGVI